MLTKPLMHRFDSIKFIKKPNLPQSRVGVVAISKNATEAINSLNRLDIRTIKIDADNRYPEPVNSHSDLQLLHTGVKSIFIQNEHLCTGELNENFDIRLIKNPPGNKYPEDVRLNCAIINDKIICNKKTIAKEILEYAETENLTVINVNQGYSKCSICIVNENAIITDDKSIFTATQNYFDDVLLVSKKSIRLKGYEYGFIGGCCGKIDKDKLAFNGVLESHSDYKLIDDFIRRNNVEAIELSRECLTDIGGILPLTERI